MSRPLKYMRLGRSIMSNGDILRAGGTFLGTVKLNEGDPFNLLMPDGSRKNQSKGIADGYHQLGLGILIMIGMYSSQNIILCICQQGDIKIFSIPKTIVHDVCYLGMLLVSLPLSKRLPTLPIAWHRHQPSPVDSLTSLRPAPSLALNAGTTGGANVVLIPEIR